MLLFFPLSECDLFLPEKLQASLSINIKHMPAAMIPPKPAVITRQSHVYSSQAHLVNVDVMLLFLSQSSWYLMSLIFDMSLDLIIVHRKDCFARDYADHHLCIQTPGSCVVQDCSVSLSSEKDHTMDTLPGHMGAVKALQTREVQLQHWLYCRRKMPISLRHCGLLKDVSLLAFRDLETGQSQPGPWGASPMAYLHNLTVPQTS